MSGIEIRQRTASEGQKSSVPIFKMGALVAI